jgi:hypothetical protein
MMEALMMLLSAEMPVDAMADLLDEHDDWYTLIDSEDAGYIDKLGLISRGNRR